MRRRFALVAIALLAVAGCGGDDVSPQEAAEVENQVEEAKRKERFQALVRARAVELRREKAGVEPPKPPAKFTGAQADRWDYDRVVCAALPASELAEGLKLDADAAPEEIARAYSKSWPDEYRQASYEGCLRGIEEPIDVRE